jgi:CPA2 family monovalent cation:H+ antiporter-2
MDQLPKLITDLTLILAMAGIVTVLFKRLKQPLVLGYVVAGFLSSPNMPYTPTVSDMSSVQTWADIGVLFLLFALGLEFSFKKIFKMGGAPFIAACTIIFMMMILGMIVGHSFGWSRMNCIFLGGMLAMSSTTIIYKALDDMKLRQQRFAGLVLSVLILEDILAILLMVMLSTLAASSKDAGGAMMNGLLKLVFFIILWFVVGVYLIPLFLRKFRRWINDETLLIVSLSLCFIMVLIAVKVGFSAAFGAFMMGSILAETVEAERIEKLVAPVKDLFGAIFFVSVGMLVEPQVLIQYWLPILILTLTVLIGQAIFGSLGFLFSGQSLKVSMQCGFTMAQIGEFAFIIASLGVSLGVTGRFLYPIVVAVSVITTFLTPYMIRLANPAYKVAIRALPSGWTRLIDTYNQGTAATVNHSSDWRKLLISMAKETSVYTVLSIAVIVLSFTFFLPFIRSLLPHWWANGVCGTLTILCVSPFLRSIVMKKNHSEEWKSLWETSVYNRFPLIFTILVRVAIAAAIVFYIINFLSRFANAMIIVAALLIVGAMIASRRLKRQSIRLERRFMENLNSRERRAEVMGQRKPLFAGHLLSRDLHLSDFDVPADSLWAGKTLRELGLRGRFGILVTSILRGHLRINVPGAETTIFPMDRIQVIGTDEQTARFADELRDNIHPSRSAD